METTIQAMTIIQEVFKMPNQTLIEKVKLSARISGDAFDDDVQDMIESAREELIQSGVSRKMAESEDDPLIIRALKIYTKANFGIDSPNAYRFQRSFESLTRHLSMAGDYNDELE